MQVRVVNRKKGELNLPLIYLIITIILTGSAYGLFRLHSVPFLPCPFKEMTGYPCPTCGSTRMVLSLFHINFIDAFLWNPGVFLSGVAAVFWFGYGIISQLKRKKLYFSLSKREGFWLRVLLLGGFMINWLYLVIAGI
ncbi:MAG: DUF2752 domain-containing protein [Acidobacteria bacterium]|nr:DUF2752 domain-containing protein [Acidobacteriota bacterium]